MNYIYTERICFLHSYFNQTGIFNSYSNFTLRSFKAKFKATLKLLFVCFVCDKLRSCRYGFIITLLALHNL